ncbi:MAG: DUF3297 family protein [Rhodospirillaceae bacterium]|nr:DUF3297 family protein [Rhodospirillaceae bacterium]
MTDTPPDRLSVDARSPFFNEEVLAKGIGIRFNGRNRTDVLEYSVSEGWILVAAGKSRDRYGNPMTTRIKGTVEPFFDQAMGVAKPDAPSA